MSLLLPGVWSYFKRKVHFLLFLGCANNGFGGSWNAFICPSDDQSHVGIPVAPAAHVGCNSVSVCVAWRPSPVPRWPQDSSKAYAQAHPKGSHRINIWHRQKMHLFDFMAFMMV